MSSIIEQVVTESITPGENSASLSVLFALLAFCVILNLFFWLLIDSFHFLVIALLSAVLLVLIGKFQSQFSSALNKEAGEASKKDD